MKRDELIKTMTGWVGAVRGDRQRGGDPLRPDG